MVRLEILSGKMAGQYIDIRHFPFIAGRGKESDWIVEEAGVWDSHFTISITPEKLLRIRAEKGTPIEVNGESVQDEVLRNGDVVAAGALKVRFGLSPTRQFSFIGREWATWVSLALLALVQVALIYHFLA